MRKFTTQLPLLILTFLCLGNYNAFAQPSFTLNGGNVCEGEPVSVNVTVEDFADMISFQYTLEWDATVIEIIDITDVNMAISDIQFGLFTSESETLTVSWFDNLLGGVTLDDEDVLFTLNFNGVGANSALTMLSFIDNPAVREVSALVNGDIEIVMGSEWNDGMIMVAQPELAEVVIQNDVNMTGVGAINISVTNGTAPYTYAWDNGETTEDLVDVATGDYACVVTDAKGCETDLGMFTVDNTVSTQEIKDLISVALYPNPSTGDLNLEAQFENPQDVQVNIFNLLGEKVYFNQIENANIDLELDLSNLAIGTYIVQLRTNDGMHVEKLQIQK